MKLAAICCAVGVSGAAQDAAGLIQRSVARSGQAPFFNESVVAGCSEADLQMAKNRASEINEDVITHMLQIGPRIIRPGGSTGTDAWREVMKGDLAKSVPTVCQDLDDGYDVGECIHDFLSVSWSCAKCFPTFSVVAEKCSSPCQTKSEAIAQRPEVKKMPSQSGVELVFGNLLGSLTEKLTSATEDLEEAGPCLECSRPVAVDFVKCTMGDEYAQAFDKEFAKAVEASG